MKRELDDERHELFGNKVRKLRRESCQESRAVGLLVRLEAARGIYFLQVGVRPVRIIIWWLITIPISRQNGTRAKE